ncbi:TPA: pilus assembly protein [Burkholderia vietnamiensis]|uniref:TadE/TadG family type IV pilus assembly protein n=1 Tax=Burkholderia vietnamiensis TaxID=60552 RepID=UPI001CF5ED13|nr:TadE family protein [Burkholderia vietnamiensis]MCA8268529.1 pilus assembly protein [Burkholderia vietnamiensis]UKV75255.1 pilus assembly protein [Burkholderia vietnamiensis]HDR8929250.1 pilus assembly protein [Burkholderia vietnamiensis]HDR9212374.1 pilus assembly protein [Burkholderia vietnamiensis]HDV8349886.1 pilus assembly protein [Burkholderia vietnamiensis]
MKRQGRPARYRRQRGATAVEFAIIFPLFFVICYAIICFGMIFVIQQSLTFAASEGARAALNYAPDLATRTSKAQSAAQTVVGWLNISEPSVTVQAPACKYDATLYCLSVTVSYSPRAWVTTMPFLGTIVTQPLTSTAVVQISQSLLQ